MSILTVSAILGGWISLPEKFLVKIPEDEDPDSTRQVPALSFLITHRDIEGHETRVLFDLGILHQPERPIRKLEWNNWEVDTRSNVLDELKRNGLKTQDIDLVILSHCHFDHSGDARLFPAPTYFLVGPGTLDRMNRGVRGCGGGAPHYKQDLLPADASDNRTIELSASDTSDVPVLGASTPLNLVWSEFSAQLPHRVIDLFGDQSVYIVDAPGHIDGHINLLIRVADGDSFVYLAGDSCHDVRVIEGHAEIGKWAKEGGCGEASMHENLQRAQQNVRDIRKLGEFIESEGGKMQVIIAHDEKWAKENEQAFLPGKI